jgi:hypothetical protein
MEQRESTSSININVVYTADTNKTNADLFSKMSSFLKEETRLIADHRKQMRDKYPGLYV